jgi:hypothetical protein
VAAGVTELAAAATGGSRAGRRPPSNPLYPQALPPAIVSIALSGDERRRNFALLQAIADAIGRELESTSYDELVAAGPERTFSREIDGVRVDVHAQSRRRAGDGALSVEVAVRSDLPMPFGARPAYAFRKRPDGSVF